MRMDTYEDMSCSESDTDVFMRRERECMGGNCCPIVYQARYGYSYVTLLFEVNIISFTLKCVYALLCMGESPPVMHAGS